MPGKGSTPCLESSQLCLGLAPYGERAMGRHVLHVHTVQLQPAVFPHLIVVVSVPLGESPLLADKDLLAPRELELGAPKSLNTFGLELVMGSDGDEDLTDPDPCRKLLSFQSGAYQLLRTTTFC